MTESAITEALAHGDAEAFLYANIEADVLAGEAVQTALLRAAEQVVFHRMPFHETVKAVVGLGAPCEIWTAARAGLLAEVERQIQADPALLNATDPAGRTPLQRAALIYGVCEPCEAVADCLIAAGASMDIFTAATFGLAKEVDEELSRDAALVSARCQGSNPLNWAVRPRRHGEQAAGICSALIAAGADLNDRDEDECGMTPLHHAAEWGGSHGHEVVEALLSAGADPQAKDEQGWTPLDYAKDRGRTKIVKRLGG